jgi:type IV fimbrial biogenesis protein FimT
MVQNLRFPRSTVQLGFSLIEVMVVVAIAGLLLALAAPSFTPVIERWRVRSATEALQGSIFTARSAAIKHAGDVVLKKNDTGPNGCVSSGATDFKCGWLIWHDGLLRDGNQSACTPTEQTECTIIEFSPPPNVELTVTGATNGRLYFNRQGRITDDTGAIQNNVTVEVIAKHRVITDNNSRRLCIAGAGRSRVIPGYEAC